MLKRTTIERSLEKYADGKDPQVAARLARFAPLLLAAADIRENLPEVEESFTKEEILDSLTKGKTLFSRHPVVIDAAAFQDALEKLAASLHLPAQDVNWTIACNPQLLSEAGRDPSGYLEKVATAYEATPELRDRFIMPVICYGLRAFLDEAADEASREIAAVNTDATQFDEPRSCPVCGAAPALASVGETARNGSQKRLWCNCCGAHWVFERIRCVGCGSSVVSDFTYVHDEADSAHRLHVCRHCQEAFPTLFQSSLFSADVEAIVFSGLEDAFAASKK